MILLRNEEHCSGSIRLAWIAALEPVSTQQQQQEKIPKFLSEKQLPQCE